MVAIPDEVIGQVERRVGTITYLDKMLGEPFDTFSFSPTAASVYQLGNFGTARKELKTFQLKR